MTELALAFCAIKQNYSKKMIQMKWKITKNIENRYHTTVKDCSSHSKESMIDLVFSG